MNEKMEVFFGNQAVEVMNSHKEMMKLHYRVLACHCECLGMNAENSWAVCVNQSISYSQAHYFEAMQKWSLINEKGEPTL